MTPEERKAKLDAMMRDPKKVEELTRPTLVAPWIVMKGRDWAIDLDNAPRLDFLFTDEEGKKWQVRTTFKELMRYIISPIHWTRADFPPDISIEEVKDGEA